MYDFRLAFPAIGIWIGGALGLLIAAGRLPLGLLLLAVPGALLVRRWRHRGAGRQLAVALIVLQAAALVGYWRGAAANPPEIRSLVGATGIVQVEVFVDGDPYLVEQRAFGGLTTRQQYRARVTLLRIDSEQRSWRTSLPCTLQWDAGRGAVAAGRTLRVAALLHPDDLLRRSVYRISARGDFTTVGEGSRGGAVARAVRQGLGRATGALQADGTVSSTARAGARLLPGLVLGDTRAQDEALVERLRISGLTHLSAVSGANIAILTGALWWLLGRFRVRPRVRSLVTALAVLAFVAVVQPQPSVLRAAAMGLIGIWAVATGRRKGSTSALWATVSVLLLLDPFLALSYGFALSVAATLGLLVLQPILADRLPVRRAWWATALLLTTSAQIATLPLLLLMGSPPTWASLPANLLAEPLVAPATIIGCVTALVAAIGLLPVARLLAVPAVLLAECIAAIAGLLSESTLAVAPIAGLRDVCIVALLGGVYWAGPRRGVPRRLTVAALVTWLVLQSWNPFAGRWVPDDWWYAQCDVGQGDATLVRVAERSAVVIDAGPEPALMRACLRRFGVDAVPVLILTHFHADHVEGVPGVLGAAAVGRVLVNGYVEPAVEYDRVRAAVGDVPMAELRPGSQIVVGAVRIDVHAAPAETRASGSAPNNASLVLAVRSGGRSALITGDIEPAAQQALLPFVGRVDVLKVPHHGSRNQWAPFLQQVRPAVAVVSVGAGNDYGHPAADTLRLLRAGGATVLRTDQHGAVAIGGRGRLSVAHGRLGA